ncbi:MAG: hypothetical protein IJQ75_05715 [Synergistaceae bacterium]|nr:hypothetical protein [Synergistaceae bacterium]
MTRIENAINGIPQRIETTRGQLENYHNQVKAAEEELQRPFAHADELKEKTERLAKLNAELTIQEHPQPPVQETPPSVDPASIEPETPKVESEPSIVNPITVENHLEMGEAVNFKGVPETEGKLHFGIPEAKSPLSEQTIRDMKLVDDPVIYMKPRTDGQQYKGEILHVDKEQGYCVQLSGKHSLFVHSLERLERTPEVGETLKLSYSHDDGQKATLSIQETRSHTQTRGRR